MRRFAKAFALLILLGLFGMQVHLALEQFSAPAGRIALQCSSTQDFDHQADRHFCAVCMAGIWATLSALPQLGLATATSLLRIESPEVCGPISFGEASSPRAPPLA